MSFTVKDPKTCDFASGNKNTRVHVSANFLMCRNVISLLRLRGRARLGEGSVPGSPGDGRVLEKSGVFTGLSLEADTGVPGAAVTNHRRISQPSGWRSGSRHGGALGAWAPDLMLGLWSSRILGFLGVATSPQAIPVSLVCLSLWTWGSPG